MGLLTEYVLAIRDAPQHLTEEDRFILIKLLGMRAADEPGATADGTILGKTLNSLSDMAAKMYQQALLNPEDTDLMKATAGTLKQVLDTAVKYQDKVKAADQAAQVETALIDAVKSFGDKELERRFRESLKHTLESRS